MRLHGAVALGAALALAAGASRATPPPIMHPSTPAAVTLRGLDGHAVALTTADLAKLPQMHVSVTHAGRTADYAGPALAGLLRQVDAPLGARLHGPAVATAVLVSASDDYRVVLSLGEVDPELRSGAKVILADQVDGHALSPDEAPARLVVDGDGRPARDAHSVVSIELRRLP